MRALMAIIYMGVLIAGCVQVGDEPLTAEDRCVILCQGNASGHPCKGQMIAEDCVETCTTHITPLRDECLTCVLTQSGWIGTSCECESVDAFGMVDVTCDACAYTTHDRKCAASTECTRDLEMCEGFDLVAPSDPICSPACL